MLHRSIQAQENERKRISRELHDSVIQDMLNIDVELRLLKYKHRDKVLAETSQRIEGLLSQLIDDIRNMSVELRPSSLDDLGIEAALNHILNSLKKIMVCILNMIRTLKACVLIMKLKQLCIV